MRNVVVGSFVGFVLAAAFLAACGSGGDEASGGGPAAISTPSREKWSAPGTNFIIVTGVDLTAGTTWDGTAFYDNSVAEARDRYAAFEVMGNVSSGTATIEVGFLPAVNGTDYATEPEWLGRVVLTAGSNRRGALSNVWIPPSRGRFALRLLSGGAGSVRVLRYSMTPYNVELQ